MISPTLPHKPLTSPRLIYWLLQVKRIFTLRFLPSSFSKALFDLDVVVLLGGTQYIVLIKYVEGKDGLGVGAPSWWVGQGDYACEIRWLGHQGEGGGRCTGERARLGRGVGGHRVAAARLGLEKRVIGHLDQLFGENRALRQPGSGAEGERQGHGRVAGSEGMFLHGSA
jgi:hypothetical protein